MKGVRIVVVLGVVAVVALLVRHFALAPSTLVLTGIVTTQDVIMSPQIGGRVNQLLVKEGDAVTRDQLLAVIAPDELKPEAAFSTQSAGGLPAQVQEGKPALRYQERQAAQQIEQAKAVLAASEA